MSKILQRSAITVMLSATAGNAAVFQVNIPLSFKSDEVIIRQVSYTTVGADVQSFLVYTDMVSDQILCTFPNADSVSTPQTRFSLPNFNTSKNTVFQIQQIKAGETATVGNGDVTTLADGVLAIVLEFIQFK